MERSIDLLFFLTTVIDGVGGQRHASAALAPGKKPGTHFIRSCVGLRARLDECGKNYPTGIQSPDSPSRCELLYRLSYHGPNLSGSESELTAL